MKMFSPNICPLLPLSFWQRQTRTFRTVQTHQRLSMKNPFSQIVVALFMAIVSTHAENVAAPTGITEPFLHVTLSASVAGIVTARRFKEGDTVREGQPILELDKTLEEIETARRGVIADEKKRDYDSTALLYEKTKSVSKEDMLKKESDYKVAVAERDIAAEQLRRRIITAPFTGQITDILVESGEACQPYQPIVRVVDTSRCYFVSNLDAKFASRLHQDASVKLEVETGATTVTVTAKIIFISPVVDPASGLVKIRALFENAGGKIRPGLSGKLVLE